MDEFDLKLLDALQHDGRLTNHELADVVGLSASQCSRRRSALEASGIIESYRAMLAADEIGVALFAFVEISLTRHSKKISADFFAMLDKLDAVQEAYALTGDADYLIKIAAPNLDALSRFLNDHLLSHDSVARLRSSIVLQRLKHTTRLPLGHLRQT
jgi:DNA-binding Lrp family transcriptional regulator